MFPNNDQFQKGFLKYHGSGLHLSMRSLGMTSTRASLRKALIIHRYPMKTSYPQLQPVPVTYNIFSVEEDFEKAVIFEVRLEFTFVKALFPSLLPLLMVRSRIMATPRDLGLYL